MKKDEIIQKCFDRKIDDVIRESTLFRVLLIYADYWTEHNVKFMYQLCIIGKGK